MKQNDNLRKRMLAQIMEKEQQQHFQKKVVARHMDNLENQQVDLFWAVLSPLRRTKRNDSGQSRAKGDSISMRLGNSITPL